MATPMEVEETPIVLTEASRTPEESLALLLKKCLARDQLARGVHEVTKALEARHAHLLVLSNSIDEQALKQLLEALAKKFNVPIFYIENSKKLGEMCGLCKIDKDGNPRKVVGCSCAVIKDVGRETKLFEKVQQSLKK